MQQVFTGQPFFNQPLNSWNTSNVTNMNFMFYSYILPRSGGLFNQPLNSWNTNKVTTMASMFYGQRMFNQNIGSWDVSNVTNMNSMFINQSYDGAFNNGDDSSIKNWNTSKVSFFAGMFQGQPFFNQEVGLWNLSSSSDIRQMFAGYGSPRSASIFNNSGSDSIKNWNLGNSTSSLFLFGNATSFNQPIGSWDMSKMTNIQQMFTSTSGRTGSFNQNIGSWNVSLVTVGTSFMALRTFNDFSTANYDALLNGWASRTVKPSVSINFGTIKYTSAASASRAILTGAPNSWTIVDGGIA
jgi:surface protein